MGLGFMGQSIAQSAGCLFLLYRFSTDRLGDQADLGDDSPATMKRPPTVNAVIKDKSTMRNPRSGRYPQDRRMTALAALNPQPVRIEQLMDRLGELSIVLETRQRLAGQLFQLTLNRQPDRPLEPMEFSVQVGQRGLSFVSVRVLARHSSGRVSGGNRSGQAICV
jgi:hypothetical protein